MNYFETAKEVRALAAAIASGEAFRAAEIADQYGGTVCWARRLRNDEKTKYAEWCRDLIMVGYAGSRSIKVSETAITRVLGDRRADGTFPGCTNRAWTISAEEWDKILSESAQIASDQRASEAREAKAEADDIARKVESGYCFYCGTWCHGDCGHYSNNPTVKQLRDNATAIKEMRYGIDD